MKSNAPLALSPETIRALRLRLHVNQEAFAALIGCTQAAVSRWEDGRRTPTGLYDRAVRNLLSAHPPGIDRERPRDHQRNEQE